jgi:hypothetical protein
MPTLEEFTATAQTEIDAIKTANGGVGLWKQTTEEKREYTETEYDQAVIEKGKDDFSFQENGYKTARQNAYASIQDQLDMQYWDEVNGTTTWKDHIAQVKSDNPKPS